jgi:hypothetical protein
MSSVCQVQTISTMSRFDRNSTRDSCEISVYSIGIMYEGVSKSFQTDSMTK